MATQKDFIVKNGLDVGGDVEAAGSGSFVGLDVTGNVVLGGTVNPQITLNDTSTSNLIHTITSGSDKLQISTDPNQVHASSRIEFLVDATERAQITDVGMDVTGNLTASGDLTVTGDLIVNGTSTTLNVATLDVEDKNITLNFGAGDTSASADGAGITIQDAVDASNDASILWDATDNKFDFSHRVDVAGLITSTSLTVDGISNLNNHVKIANGYSLGWDDITTRITGNSSTDLIQIYTNAIKRLDVQADGDIAFYKTNGASPPVPVVGMHWDYADGKLGIGTDDPSRNLTVKVGSGQEGIELIDADESLFLVQKSGSSTNTSYVSMLSEGSTTVRLHADNVSYFNGGNVGIGTDAPQQLLELSSGTSPHLRITNTTNSNAHDNGDVFGGVEFFTADTGYDGPIVNGYVRSMHLRTGGGTGHSSADGGLQFGVSEGTQDIEAVAAMSIVTGGNVGIGTDSPTQALDVRTQAVVGNGTDGVKLTYSTGNSSGIIDTGFSSTALEFRTGNSFAALIDSSGKVGVGNDSPTYDLDVTGQGRFTTDLRLGSENLRLSTDGSGEFGLGYGTTHTTANRFRVYQNTTPVFSVRDDGAIDTTQVRHPGRPTLSLDFANGKKLDRRVSFDRNSIATYHDEDGTLKRANFNEPRFNYNPVTGNSKGLLIEGPVTNYLKYNEHMAIDTTYANVGVLRNYGKSPTGEFNSIALRENLGTTSHYISRSLNNVEATANTVVATVSVYAKSAERSGLQIRHQNGSGSFSYVIANFNLDTGTVISNTVHQAANVSVRIEDVGNGWHRCSVTCSFTDTAVVSRNPQFWVFDTVGNNHTQTGDGKIAIELYGMQFEEKAWTSSFIPADTKFLTRVSEATYWDENSNLVTASANEPRYGYTEPYQVEIFGKNSSGPVARNALKLTPRKQLETGLILEPAATNLVTYSYNMSTANHGSAATSFEPTTETKAPDGSYTASKIVFSGASSRLDENHGTFSDGQYYTLSMWVKGVAGTIISSALLTNTGANVEVKYVLTGDWQRVVVTKKFLSSEGGTLIRTHGVIIRSTVGAAATALDGTVGTWASYVYVWGMQVEGGPVPTSYIPTQGAAVTRAADVGSSVVENVREQDFAKLHDLSWYSQKESTIYGEGTSITFNQDVGSNPALWGITDGTSTNRYLLRRHDNDPSNDATKGGFTFRLCMTGGINNDYFTSNTAMPDWDDDVVHKMALGIKENSQIAAADGLDAQMSSITAPQYDTPTMAEIGFGGSSAAWNGHIRKISYYPTQLTLAQLQALTENN